MDGYFPKQAKSIFSSNGKVLIQEIGFDIIRGVVTDVLCGKNLRDSTELLTRKRILSLNAATLVMLIKGTAEKQNYIARLPEYAYERLISKDVDKNERWLMQWILGLTDKACQNVLRDNTSNLENYKNSYIDITKKTIETCNRNYGEIGGTITLTPQLKATLNWEFLVQLMSATGSQTLAVRGSDKSMFGKLFEKLILGTLLSLLGFKLVEPNNITMANKVFWLTSRADKRESDATLIYGPGKGVRFDIGFIGRGNPEISLDKVSRFEREIQIGKRKLYMATIIIVDRIGQNSRIERLASDIGGYIVQMSGAYWPYKVAHMLKEILDYSDPILKIKPDKMGDYIKTKVNQIPFEQILNIKAFTNS